MKYFINWQHKLLALVEAMPHETEASISTAKRMAANATKRNFSAQFLLSHLTSCWFGPF